MYVCLCVCVCIYQITHDRAIRPCHLSHSMPLALILPRVDQLYLLRKPLIRRDKGDTLYLLYSSYLSSECFVPPAQLTCSSLNYMGRQLLYQPFLIYLFSLSGQVSPVSRIASTTPEGFSALLHLSSALPDPVLVPAPVSTTVVFPVPAPVDVPILCSSTGLHPRPRPRSRLVSTPVLVSISRSFSHFHPRLCLFDPRKGGSMILVTKTSDQTRQRGHTLSTCTNLT